MEPTGPERNHTAAVWAGCALVVILFAATTTARGSWDGISRVLGLQGKPEPASASVLSQHHLESLDSMPAQGQAEFLLERSINHYDGANGEIEARLPKWRGSIEPSDRFESLFRMAINSDDLRVCAAAIEINILSRKLDKNLETVERLEPIARGGAQGPRANALWDLGLIGNRGVEQERIVEILSASLQDKNVNVRYWAVEGLAYLGTDAAIAPLLETFRDDESPMIRERAACGVAQSGMLTRQQRMKAVPKLLDYAGDLSMDDQTRGWVFQALRDITGQSLPPDATAWREWYRLHS